MELELSGIVRAVGKNHSITHLSLSKLTGKRSYAPPLVQVRPTSTPRLGVANEVY